MRLILERVYSMAEFCSCVSWQIGMLKRRYPYTASFSIMAARMIDPC